MLRKTYFLFDGADTFFCFFSSRISVNLKPSSLSCSIFIYSVSIISSFYLIYFFLLLFWLRIVLYALMIFLSSPFIRVYFTLCDLTTLADSFICLYSWDICFSLSLPYYLCFFLFSSSNFFSSANFIYAYCFKTSK